MKFKYKVKILNSLDTYCPSQWIGEWENGDELYIRYRHSWLRVERNGKIIFSKTTNEDDGGVMNTDEMLKITGLKMLNNY